MSSNISARKSSWRYALDHTIFSWVSLWKTIKVAVKLRQAAIFLVAWFLLSDAIATMSGTAILFAKTELHMASTAIAVVSIIATTSGIAGAFTWPIISKRLGLKSNQTILARIAMFEIIPIYGLLYYIPFIKGWGFGGLQQAWEIYPLAFVHGFVMGGLSPYCRSFFGLLIPPGNEAAFYALYAITDKGSSVIGPAIVGLIVDKTGQIRPAFGFLAVIVLLPAPLIWLVDAECGRADSILMAEVIRKSKASDDNTSTHERSEEEAEGLLNDRD
jgi:MFS transporter, UMF1 family